MEATPTAPPAAFPPYRTLGARALEGAAPEPPGNEVPEPEPGGLFDGNGAAVATDFTASSDAAASA